MIILNYPPDYEYETEEHQRKTPIITDDFIEWRRHNHRYGSKLSFPCYSPGEVRAVHARGARRLIVRPSEIFSAYKSASLVRLLAADTSAAEAPRRQDDDDGVPSPDLAAQVENDPIVKAAIQAYEEARARAYEEARKRI